MKNGEFIRALRRVGGRVRAVRAWKAFLWGLAAAGALADLIAAYLDLTPQEKQDVIETMDISARADR